MDYCHNDWTYWFAYCSTSENTICSLVWIISDHRCNSLNNENWKLNPHLWGIDHQRLLFSTMFMLLRLQSYWHAMELRYYRSIPNNPQFAKYSKYIEMISILEAMVWFNRLPVTKMNGERCVCTLLTANEATYDIN